MFGIENTILLNEEFNKEILYDDTEKLQNINLINNNIIWRNKETAI